MAGQADATRTCDACGATIYPEHLQKRAAGFAEDRLLCPHCLRQRRQPDPPAAEADAPPIALVEQEELETSRRPASIQAFGQPAVAPGAPAPAQRQWRRPLLKGSGNATRCRTFHCKLSDASFAHLNEQINQWVDGDDEIEIKFAVSSIGVVEGKHADPHLVLTVFY